MICWKVNMRRQAGAGPGFGRTAAGRIREGRDFTGRLAARGAALPQRPGTPPAPDIQAGAA